MLKLGKVISKSTFSLTVDNSDTKDKANASRRALIILWGGHCFASKESSI
jgi:hypothetical protein